MKPWAPRPASLPGSESADAPEQAVGAPRPHVRAPQEPTLGDQPAGGSAAIAFQTAALDSPTAPVETSAAIPSPSRELSRVREAEASPPTPDCEAGTSERPEATTGPVNPSVAPVTETTEGPSQNKSSIW